MKLYYDDFTQCDIDSEIEKINQSTEVVFNFDGKRVDHLFLFGILFAAGVNLTVENLDEIDLSNRTYPHAAHHWVSNKLTPNIKNNSDDKKIFLICPVKKATDKELSLMKKYISDMESRGYIVHYPARDTHQDDTIGYKIATENSVANGDAMHIAICYAEETTGSYFDLGVSYYLHYMNPERTFTMLNPDRYMDINNFGDKIVILMQNKCNELV